MMRLGDGVCGMLMCVVIEWYNCYLFFGRFSCVKMLFFCGMKLVMMGWFVLSVLINLCVCCVCCSVNDSWIGSV